jgi:hypothetical protein
VAHICNPSYLGGGDQGDQGSRSGGVGRNVDKKLASPFLSKLGMVMHACDPSFLEGIGRRIVL